MLVTFSSSTSGEILMFADIAHRLFELIGKDGTARGVFTSEQLPDAIEKLRQAVLAEKGESSRNNPPAAAPEEESSTTPDIGLAQRAYPLIELMERTSKDAGFVMWQAAGDF